MESSDKSISNSKMFVLIVLSVLLRWTVSFFDYSGHKKPPMFGDYEAQRHWMEITFNLPVQNWYLNSTENDLNYWGLDYPPLTAYHSLVCGYFSNIINPEYVKLNTSRGYESDDHKLFMRSTVLISDLSTYIFASCLIAKLFKSEMLGIVLLMYPGIILIDYGHFQYNCISIGLALFSFICFTNNSDTFGSIFFCLALNFKQMLLYYAFPIFFYLLGKCYKSGKRRGFIKFLKLSFTVILTFLILWYPLLNVSNHVLKRLFPIERGLFEDKVSNFWCILNIFFKIRNYFDNGQLALISALITLCAVLPNCIDTFLNPVQKKLNLSLINTSLAFFLFSYQVHEKTILLVSLPIMLFYNSEPTVSLWFLTISSLSMLPLLIKDSLTIPLISLNIIYLITCCFLINNIQIRLKSDKRNILLLISFVSSLIMILLCLYAPVPQRYPDLYSLIVSSHCALHFLFFFMYFNFIQLIKVKTI